MGDLCLESYFVVHWALLLLKACLFRLWEYSNWHNYLGGTPSEYYQYWGHHEKTMLGTVILRTLWALLLLGEFVTYALGVVPLIF